MRQPSSPTRPNSASLFNGISNINTASTFLLKLVNFRNTYGVIAQGLLVLSYSE